MSKKPKLIFLSIIVIGIFLIINKCIAATTCEQKYQGYGQCTSDCAALGSEYLTDNTAGLCTSGKCCYKTAGGIDNPSPLESINLQIPLFDLVNVSDIGQYIATIYRYLVIILVPIAIVMIILGGVMWITAAGEQGRITNAKKYIISAFSGLIIGLFSYVMLSLVGINVLNVPAIEKIEPEIGSMIVLQDGTVISTDSPEFQNMMNKLPPEQRGTPSEYDAMGCPKGQTTFKVFFTNYFKPKYGQGLGKNDFFCVVGMQCWCPRGKDTSRNCHYKKLYYPCAYFPPDTPYCVGGASGKKPVGFKTVAADSSCFNNKTGCQFKVQGSNNIFEIEDTGSWIKGHHMDVFVGDNKDNINTVLWGVHTITLLNPEKCFK